MPSSKNNPIEKDIRLCYACYIFKYDAISINGVNILNQIALLETILDNITDGVYVLDDSGNYVYVNSAYIRALNMPKSVLLDYNVHDFLTTGQISLCISDIVYREKRQVVMFQDVYDTQNYGRKPIRQMVISTPIFNKDGNIQNIVAIVRPQDITNELYNLASTRHENGVIPSVQMPPPQMAGDIIAKSADMKRILEQAQAISSVDASILITGESGTGKEVVAQFIHRSGNRSTMPFVVINCASLPENLLEAELFGYEKGAFTGADPHGKKGLFEEAEGGILFLDEINSMPVSLQGKLLRAIETKKVKRVGSNISKSVDFKLICATNEDINQMVTEKRFRLDLYYRINIVPLNIPPLRERRDDIIPLALNFLKHFSDKHNKRKVFSPNTIDNILNYQWPGNVRQLKNFVERSVVISSDEIIEFKSIEGITEAFPLSGYNPSENLNMKPATQFSGDFENLLSSGMGLSDYLEKCEEEFLKYAVQKYSSSYKVADALKTSQTSIVRRLKKYNL